MFPSTLSIHGLRQWVKARNSPVTRGLYSVITGTKTFALPSIPIVHGLLYQVHKGIVGSWAAFTRIVWYTPLFQSQLQQTAPKLYLYGGMPLILGSVEITLGSNCRVGGGDMNIAGRSQGHQIPQLSVGDNCDLGWGADILVGRKITIGNNVRLAADTFLAGYSGHPLNAKARARGEADTDDQVGDINLEDDVWLGTGACVLRGVTIGKGTIVGAASVVTRDLPANVLAAGNPARIIRELDQNDQAALEKEVIGA